MNSNYPGFVKAKDYNNYYGENVFKGQSKDTSPSPNITDEQFKEFKEMMEKVQSQYNLFNSHMPVQDLKPKEDPIVNKNNILSRVYFHGTTADGRNVKVRLDATVKKEDGAILLMWKDTDNNVYEFINISKRK